MVATVRCAPPANKPTVAERDTCAPWINRELALLAPTLRVVVALGAYGWDGALRALAGAGLRRTADRKPRFGHGARVGAGRATAHEVTLLGCYHPSQHNTFTGRLTPAMLDDVLGHRPRPGRRSELEPPGRHTVGARGTERMTSRAAPVSQPAEEAALKAVQSGFDPQRGHRVRSPGTGSGVFRHPGPVGEPQVRFARR